MKELKVQYHNPAVYVQEFLAMSQQPDEGVRHSLSRLKGVATHCDFSLDCTCKEKVSYTNHIIKFKLGSGLVDEEIKVVLRGEEKTLEDTAKVTLGGGGQLDSVLVASMQTALRRSPLRE